MAPSPEDRLDSWKEIAAYLKRDITTVQRWERREGMPVHRHVHQKSGSVYAFRPELDAWWKSRNPAPAEPARSGADIMEPPLPAPAAAPVAAPVPTPHPSQRRPMLLVAAAVAVLGIGLVFWYLATAGTAADNPLADAAYQQLTDFGGAEQAAALSADGRMVAFLSDHDGQMDVWVTQVGTARFYNLTHGTAPELINPSIRSLGFSSDGSLVTLWARRANQAGASDIGIWAVPVLGGALRPYLEGVAEFDWSRDGSRLVYHTPGPGDPMFVRERDGTLRAIFSAAPGLHAHFPVWSTDQSFIYFVQGELPDRLDIWRVRTTGGTPEQMTTHASLVSHPVFVNARTLLYLATDADGSGPWLHSLDIERRTSRRVSVGVDRYTSLAASADGKRLVATVSRPTSSLWRLRFPDGRDDGSGPERIAITTRSGVAPRLGTGFLVYVSSRGESDSLWKRQDDDAVELWTQAATRITGAPAISRDGRGIAFIAERDGRRSLHVVNSDGTGSHTLAPTLQVEGNPAWAPDGRSVTVGATVNGAPRLFTVPVDGATAVPLVSDHAVNPGWSADGTLLVYSGPDIGTQFAASVVSGTAPATVRQTLTLSRGARHLVFLPDGRSLIALRGELVHKDLWLIDTVTRVERRLTRFAPDFNVRDFDLSPDGRELVLERVQDQSDIVVINAARR